MVCGHCTLEMKLTIQSQCHHLSEFLIGEMISAVSMNVTSLKRYRPVVFAAPLMALQIYGKPTIVTDYPKEIKAFYMKLNPDGKTVAAMDILVPKIGELIGGSQRYHYLSLSFCV